MKVDTKTNGKTLAFAAPDSRDSVSAPGLSALLHRLDGWMEAAQHSAGHPWRLAIAEALAGGHAPVKPEWKETGDDAIDETAMWSLVDSTLSKVRGMCGMLSGSTSLPYNAQMVAWAAGDLLADMQAVLDQFQLRRAQGGAA